MRVKRALLVFCVALAVRAVSAQVPNPEGNVSGGPLLPEQAAIDVTHYDIAMRIDPAERTIRGAVVVSARIVQPTNWFVLDLDPRLAVDSIAALPDTGSDAGNPLRFERRGGRIWAAFPLTKQPGQSVRVKVAYGGKPRVAPRPPWDDGFVWSKTPSEAPWIGVSAEGTGADIWWPCKDHPSDRADSVELHITVPDPLVCAANGHLAGVTKNADKTSTYNWSISTPINNYAVSVNIAPYKVINTTYTSVTGEKVAAVFYAIPEHYEKAQALMPKFLKMARFFEETCGPYPFRKDKIGAAETPYLGMEHQTITAYGAGFRDNEFGYDWLLFHEFAHDWFANLVTNFDWKDMWIHEGFATYLEALYAERLKGTEGYHRYMARLLSGTANRRAVAPRETMNSVEVYIDNDIYNKGADILHSLRYLIGDKAFFTALRRMAYPDPAMERITDGRQCRYATTDDFLTIAESASGKRLAWFFEVYLRQPKLPRLTQTRDGSTLRLKWETPDGLPFPMPIDVRIGDMTRRVEMTDGQASLAIPAGVEPVVDPLHWVLRAN
jgi:aminopeptidase N